MPQHYKNKTGADRKKAWKEHRSAIKKKKARKKARKKR